MGASASHLKGHMIPSHRCQLDVKTQIYKWPLNQRSNIIAHISKPVFESVLTTWTGCCYLDSWVFSSEASLAALEADFSVFSPLR